MLNVQFFEVKNNKGKQGSHLIGFHVGFHVSSYVLKWFFIAFSVSCVLPLWYYVFVRILQCQVNLSKDKN